MPQQKAMRYAKRAENDANKKLSKSLDGPPFASSSKYRLLQLAIG
jgi:hypothetical protein